ncbi:Ran GAP Rna1, partial [Tilletia horrida]
ALCDALASHEQLQTVDLSDNAFGGRCADAMTKLFAENHSIETIRLQNNGLGISGGKIIAAALESAADKLEAAKLSSRLRSVTIGRNRLENGSAPDLARALARHGSSIEEVRVPQNGIRMQGIEELCRQLSAHCPNLRSLDVQDNTLVQRGSRALAAAIPSWPKLETLNLSDSLVRSTGSKWIFEALSEHATGLKTLLLQYCELNAGAIAALADAVEGSLHELKHLELHGNWAEEEDEAVERIKAAIEARGGKVDELGLDELEPEAEEEEEPEEDYEDSEEELEEEEEEEEGEETAEKAPVEAKAVDTIERVEPEQAETSSTPAPAEQETAPVQKEAVEAEEEAKPAAEAVKDTAEGAVAAVGAAIGALSLNG